MNKLVSVTKGCMAYLLLLDHPMDRKDIADAVDHVDVHYTLGTPRAIHALLAHGMKQVVSVDELDISVIDPKTVMTLKLG
jgi:hypothetical protein